MTGRRWHGLSIAAAALCSASPGPAQAPAGPPVAAVELPPAPFGLSQVRQGPDADRRVAWWRQARVGMFIHFGIYAVPGRGEWAMFNESIPHREYAGFADRFRPRADAPREWAALANAAGLKYMVLTARHHDGFALFDSTANDFNSVKTAARQDIVRAFLNAGRDAGLRVGLYYSPLDWRFPGYFMPDLYAESAEGMRAQYQQEMARLARGYGKIDLLWYDGGGESWLGFGGLEFRDGWRTRDKAKPYAGRFSWGDDAVNAALRQAQPHILINDRTSTIGDWRTREGWGSVRDFDDRQPWELCVTLAGSWGYTDGAEPVSLAKLVQLLSRTATRDGNLLINVGPAPDGSVPANQVARLKELGAWLRSHGEAIYDTRGGPFLPTATMGTTRSGRTVYLQLLPDADGRFPTRIAVPALDGRLRIVRAAMLGGTGGRVGIAGQGGCQLLSLPAALPDEGVRIVKLTYSGDVMAERARPFPG